METIAIPRMELLQVADAVAREKGIDRDDVLTAMEQAIQKAGRSKYGHEHDIRAQIDRKTGEIKLIRVQEVVDVVENEVTQIPVKSAARRKPDAKVGDFLIDELPPIDFGRIAAQTAKQVIVQKVREIRAQASVRRIQGPQGRSHQRPGEARRIRQHHGRSRPWRSDAAPRRIAAARNLPHRRPRPRHHLRRARRTAWAADFPQPHPSRLHGEAVRPGSPGSL